MKSLLIAIAAVLTLSNGAFAYSDNRSPIVELLDNDTLSGNVFYIACDTEDKEVQQGTYVNTNRV